MGMSSGQSTTTISRWPKWLDDPADPNNVASISGPLPVLYVSRAYFAYTDLISVAYNPIKLVAAQATEEVTGITRLATRGRNGNTTISKGKTLLTDVVEGDYLDGTSAPFQTALSKANTKADTAFTSDVTPKLGASPFVIGNPNPSENLAQSLVSGSSVKLRGRMDAQMYAKNYEFERIRQTEALPRGIDYAEQEIADAETVRRTGLYDREYRQAKDEDFYRREMEMHINRVRALEIYGNALRSLVGSQEAQTTPYHRPSPAGAILGGAATGAVVGSAVPGVGTAVGAVVGGVLGYIATSG